MSFILEVGKLYCSDRTEYPEGCEYIFSDKHELRLFFANPKRLEIDAVRKGRVQVGLLVENSVIFLLFKFGSLLWSDAPYCIWLLPESRRAAPVEIQEGQMAVLQVILIDAMTGIVSAIRAVSLDTEFSQALHGAIAHQMQHPIQPQEYSDQVDRVYAKYPDTIDMVRVAKIGGQA